MSRDGSGIYHQPFPDVATATTIESAVYNGFTRDVEQDLNAARPIIAGGTGANNAPQALVNLSGEQAHQVVTNYDMFPFVSGSFQSAPGATLAPNSTSYFVGHVAAYNSNSLVIVAYDGTTGVAYRRIKSFADGTWGAWVQDAEVALQLVTNYDTFAFVPGSFWSNGGVPGAPNPANAFVGICYAHTAPGYMIVEARAIDDGTPSGASYIRKMAGGVWGAWVQQISGLPDLDARYVNLTGDTMTGNLGFGDGNYYVGMYDPTHPIMAFEGGHYWMYDRASHGLSLNLGAAASYGFGESNTLFSGGGGFLTLQRSASPTLALQEGGTLVTNIAGTLGNCFYDFTGALHFRSITGGYADLLAMSTGGCTFGTPLSVTGAITSSGVIRGGLTTGTIAASGGAASLEVQSAGSGNAAYMTFHMPGVYATNIGIDTDGVFKIGGYSLAGVSYPIWHSGYNGIISITNTTASSSPTTGALTVAGGVGVGGDMNITGTVKASFFTSSYGGSATDGYYFFGVPGASRYLGYVAASAGFILNGGTLIITGGGVNATGNVNVSGAGNSFTTNGHGTGLVNTAGVNIGQDWAIYETNGQPAAYFNRFGSVGTLLSFHSGGTISGTISVNGATCAYNTSSDMRLKEDLKSFDAGNIIDDTEVYDFKWRDTEDRAYGVMAQQAKNVYATPFSYEKEPDRWMVDYSKYVPVLLQELKALRMRVAELEGRIGVKPS